MTGEALVWGPYDPGHFSHIYVGFSGGKDSTAMCCRLVRDEVPFRAVYLDTGWDKPDRQTGENEVLRYAQSVAARLGFPLDVVRPDKTMQELIRGGRGMPRIGKNKWCTQELKMRPKERYLRERHGKDQTGVADLVGVRWQESARRAAFDYCDERASGLTIIRPILHWTVEDVIREHHAAGIEMNPIYRDPINAERVGCWPCVMARKSEIAAVARVDPDRIREIEDLEAVVRLTTDRATKPTFFSLGHKFTPIREVVTWANTSRGGRQLTLYPEDQETGCLRWGICDLPEHEDNGGSDDG